MSTQGIYIKIYYEHKNNTKTYHYNNPVPFQSNYYFILEKKTLKSMQYRWLSKHVKKYCQSFVLNLFELLTVMILGKQTKLVIANTLLHSLRMRYYTDF